MTRYLRGCMLNLKSESGDEKDDIINGNTDYIISVGGNRFCIPRNIPKMEMGVGYC